MRDVLGEPGQQAAGRVQRGGVGGRVDDGDDGVETGSGDVVGVALAGTVGGVVVGGEDYAAAYRVAGVVHGEDGRAGGGGVAHLRAHHVLQLPRQPQRRVHQLLEPEHQHPPGTGRERLGQPGGHGGQRVLQAGPVPGREPVPPPVGQPARPAESDTADPAGHVGGSRGGRGEDGTVPVGGFGGVVGGRGGGEVLLVFRDQAPPLLQHPLREGDRAGGRGHQVDAGADLVGEGVQAARVGRGPHVDQRDDHVPLPGVAGVQVADGVEDRVAGGELVVDQDQRAVGGEQGRVLRQQQVRGRVRVGLLEAARPRHPRDRAPGGVQVGGPSQAVGDRVAEAGGGLGVTEDHGPLVLRPEQFAHPAAEGDAVPVDDGRRLGHVLAQHVGHQQVRPLGVAPQREPEQVGQPGVAPQFDTEPFGDPGPGPDRVVTGVVHESHRFSRVSRRRAVRRS